MSKYKDNDEKIFLNIFKKVIWDLFKVLQGVVCIRHTTLEERINKMISKTKQREKEGWNF